MIQPNQTQRILRLTRRYSLRDVAWIMGVDRDELRKWLSNYRSRQQYRRWAARRI